MVEVNYTKCLNLNDSRYGGTLLVDNKSCVKHIFLSVSTLVVFIIRNPSSVSSTSNYYVFLVQNSVQKFITFI